MIIIDGEDMILEYYSIISSMTYMTPKADVALSYVISRHEAVCRLPHLQILEELDIITDEVSLHYLHMGLVHLASRLSLVGAIKHLLNQPVVVEVDDTTFTIRIEAK